MGDMILNGKGYNSLIFFGVNILSIICENILIIIVII